MRALTVVVLLFALIPAARAQSGSPACAFVAGALPAETLPPGTLHGDQIPVAHVVVLMQENRSYDSYFGHLGRRSGAEQQPKDASNPDPLGGPPIRAFHKKQYCEVADLSHSWNGSHREWDGGAMDGFTAANVDPNDANGSRTMGFYTGHDLPYYRKLYHNFAIGDRYFCSVLGPTFPNRYYLLAGTSFGHIDNTLPASPDQYSQRSVFNLLEEAGVSWKIYQSLIAFGQIFAFVRNQHPEKVRPISEYFSDAQAGTLPQVAFVDPIFLGAPNVENDEHPPANVQVGEAFVATVVNALMASPLWSTSALFLTYDEHGGFYDHVPPPPACIPDGIAPMLGPGDVPSQFDRYGFRVPMAVVSPFARRRFVSHRVYDHTSILRFIETRFDLPALTRRDANADPMLELFDFAHPVLSQPKLPRAPISARKKVYCDSVAGASSGEL